MMNMLTFDVEDFGWIIHRDFLNRPAPISARVVISTQQILELLQAQGVLATFFCLGNVARAFPSLIREIRESGNEVASHGDSHLRYSNTDIETIKTDLKNSKDTIEDIIGEPVTGFRAPHFNVNLNRPEVIESIIEAGYSYDSSIFPFRGQRYGTPDSPRLPYRLQTQVGSLTEFPLATVNIGSLRLPVAGGGYLRHFPYSVTAAAIRRINEENIPATVYLHPYECDQEPFEYESKGLGLTKRLRMIFFNNHQYRNRSQTLSKLRRLNIDFNFCSIGEVIAVAPADLYPEVSLHL